MADSIFITLKKVFTHSAGTTDSVETDTGEVEEGPVASLVDTARANYQTAFAISDDDMADISINDVLHRYWGGDFPALHAYDGSESTLTSGSIMDHHAEVEKNEGTDLNWIRDVV